MPEKKRSLARRAAGRIKRSITGMSKAKPAAQASKSADKKPTVDMTKMCEYLAESTPVDFTKVVFSQFGGKGYACNPRAIAQEIIDRGLNWDLVWLLGKGHDRENSNIPDEIRVVKGRERSLMELETAGFWVNNIHFQSWIGHGLIKRPETTYLNTFHGGISIKAQGVDRPDYVKAKVENPSQKVLNQRVDSTYVDYIITSGPVEERNTDEFFDHHGEAKRLGNPRADMIINADESVRKHVLNFYNLAPDTKILLYAPTFRNSKKFSLADLFDIPYEELCAKLSERDGVPWIYMARLHPNIAKKAPELVPQGDLVIDATDYIDSQDLLVAADAIISDYSSMITEFMLSREPKPAIMYVPDLDFFASTRGIIYDLKDIPFPMAKTKEELINVMMNFDADTYDVRRKKFLEQIEYLGDGNAAKRTVDFMEEIVAQKQAARNA